MERSLSLLEKPPTLTLQVALTLDAELDLSDAVQWYDSERSGLGAEFLDEVDRRIGLILAYPALGRAIHNDVRRVLLKRFPYGIYYKRAGDRIVVVAVFHQRRDPQRLPGRF